MTDQQGASLQGRQPKEKDQNMAKKEKASAQIERDAAASGGPDFQPNLSLTTEPHELQLSEGQRLTILKYAELTAHLSERLAPKDTESKATPFTLDELDELLDHVEGSVYCAKGNERQKVLRIVEKVSKLLGSIIDPDEMPKHRLAKGIDPPIWRRIQTKDCTLEELHALIQVTMGWGFEHLYRFNIGGVEYTDLEMANDEDVEDACGTQLSEVLPARNRRPRFQYEYDFGDEWNHQLIVEERFLPEEGVKYPICVAGQRACPPEDCGGHWSYHDFVEAVSDPKHRQHEEILEWVGGGFDPEVFDIEAINRELAAVR